MHLQSAPKDKIWRPVQNNITLDAAPIGIPINLKNKIKIEKIISIKDIGKKILMPSLSMTNFKIKFKNLNVSLIGEIEELPFLTL